MFQMQSRQIWHKQVDLHIHSFLNYHLYGELYAETDVKSQSYANKLET